MHKLVGLQLFLSGTPIFSSGTPTFCQMGVLNSCFQNPSESSGCGRWNMLIAADKTEVLVFTWDGRPPDEDVVVEYGGWGGGEAQSHRF